MVFVQQPRASALPRGPEPALAPSPLRRLTARAAQRPDAVALIVDTEGGFEGRTWREVESTVHRAGAGLLRSGLRPDQIVLSLLPAAHTHPELDLALRAVGAVVVHVSADAGPDDLARELAGVDVRLVVSQTERDLDRLAGLRFGSAEMFALDGWSRLLALGAERLVMDPDAVTRVDRMVDPDGAAARLLRAGLPLVRAAADGTPPVDLPSRGVTLLVGDHADPFVQRVGDAHLATGGTLAHVAAVADLPHVLPHVQPTVLALSATASEDLPALLSRTVVPEARRRRAPRTRAAGPEALRYWFGGHLSLVVTPGRGDALRGAATTLGAELLLLEVDGLRPADLPVPPPVVMGDAATLPRRARREPGRDFQFETDRAPQFDESEGSAFVLPSLPLFGGESFLDKLLLARADQARA